MTGLGYVRLDLRQHPYAFLVWALGRYREQGLGEPTVALVSAEDYGALHQALTTRGEAYDLPVCCEGVRLEARGWHSGLVVVGREES